MAVLRGMATIVFGAKCWAFCTIVELSYNVFFKLNDLHISTSVPASREKCNTKKGAGIPYRHVSSEKSTRIVVDMVADVIVVLLMYQ